MKATKAWWEDEGNFELQEHKEQMYTTLNQYQQIFKTRRYEVDGQGQLEDEEPLTRDELEEKHFPIKEFGQIVDNKLPLNSPIAITFYMKTLEADDFDNMPMIETSLVSTNPTN